MSVAHSTATSRESIDDSARPRPRVAVDARGRLIPMTEDEVKARAPEVARGLAALAEIGSEDEQRRTLEALIEAIDSEPLSDRKRFG